jgi:hypothetical protein
MNTYIVTTIPEGVDASNILEYIIFSVARILRSVGRDTSIQKSDLLIVM